MPSKPASYYAGFDYLRAMLALAVIAIHTELLSVYGRFTLKDATGVNVFDVIQFNLLFLAVPVFILISLFLFYKKQGGLRSDGRKIYQLIVLYCFWVGLWILFKGKHPDGLSDLFMFVIRGGKSIFWFFFSLTAMTVLASVTRNLTVRLSWLALILATAAVAIFPILNIYDPTYSYLVAFWNPLLFVPYVFAARLFVHYEDRLSRYRSLQLLLLIAFIVLSILEWQLLVHPHHLLSQAVPIPIYGRLSVVIGAFLLFVLFLPVRSHSPKLVKILSSASLGLYCTHMFLIELASTLTEGRLDLSPILYFLLITIASLAATYCLKQVFRERLI